jgi:carbamoyl-phosphate synthase small subunit
MVQAVTCQGIHAWQDDSAQAWVPAQPNPAQGLHVVVYDYGAKRNILRHLSAYGLKLSLVPAATPAKVVLALNPQGICLSNGPGDPLGLPYAIQAVQELLESGRPILGICLGHQLLGLALGGRTRRLKFGHHGSNHPVQDLRSAKVLVTAQNHNYHVEIESLDRSQVEITHVSLNDGTLEGRASAR